MNPEEFFGMLMGDESLIFFVSCIQGIKKGTIEEVEANLENVNCVLIEDDGYIIMYDNDLQTWLHAYEIVEEDRSIFESLLGYPLGELQTQEDYIRTNYEPTDELALMTPFMG